MQKYKITVAYDGTCYHGWQIQPSDITVVSTLQSTFKRIFGKEIIIVGASRTDAGVHSLGQVAHFSVDNLLIPPSRILAAWNAALPLDITIRSLDPVDQSFHACFDVKQKTYYYHLFLKRPLPHIARYGWHYRFVDKVDWQKFEQGLQFFVGEHDFTAFCKLEDDKHPVRTIDSILVRYYSPFKVFQVVIKGKSFLRYQIRRIIGYTLDVARRSDLRVDYLKEVLASKNPQQTLLQADGSGLCLRKVVYHDKIHE